MKVSAAFQVSLILLMAQKMKPPTIFQKLNQPLLLSVVPELQFVVQSPRHNGRGRNGLL